MTCNVTETREMQRKQANSIATACVGKKQSKAAKMFQDRFERSEKFAIVREPVVTSHEQNVTSEEAVATPEPEAEGATSEEQEPGTEMTKITEPAVIPEVAMECQPISDAREPFQLNVEFNSCPLPWLESAYVTNASEYVTTPAPVYRDFNRNPRGFAGSYVSPYGDYVTILETEDL
uniref:Uncharacterized protein n=1 Tax=Ciona savignyi TaxID=51511 RepID=H2Z926_CIOSA